MKQLKTQKQPVMRLHFKCLCDGNRYEVWRGLFIACVKCQRGWGVLNGQWTLWRCLKCRKETGCDCVPTRRMQKLKWECPVYRYGIIKIGDRRSKAAIERRVRSGIPKAIVFPSPKAKINYEGPEVK